MMRRLLVSYGAVALIAGFVAAPQASAQQSFNFYIGGFTPRAADARGTNDVLFQDLNTFAFRINDFNGATVGGEYLVGLTHNFEGGLGIGFYQRTVPSVYLNFVNSDGSEIEQDLKLRVIPFTATIRFLPLGNDGPFKPYVGGGVGIYAWRYSETGQFIDENNNVFLGNFVGSGTTVGPVILGGVRVPIGAVDVGGEIRYQGGKADLPSDQTFAGPKLDLSGFNYLFLINIHF
jgi:outer membrane protein W